MISPANYINSLEAEQRDLCAFLHQILVNDLGLTPKMRYKIPFYDCISWICYLNPQKNQGIELAFIRGNELADTHSLLQAKDRKQIRGITWQHPTQIALPPLLELLHQAILLDQIHAKQKK